MNEDVDVYEFDTDRKAANYRCASHAGEENKRLHSYPCPGKRIVSPSYIQQ